MSQDATYRERLLPRWPLLVVIAAAIAMLATAYGAALGAGLGWTVLLGGLLVGAVVVLVASPVVAVTDAGLRAGRAVLPPAAIGEAVVLDHAALEAGRVPGAPVYEIVRGRRGGVKVVVDDPADPHRAWLVSSAHPDKLVRAIRLQGSRASAPGAAGTDRKD